MENILKRGSEYLETAPENTSVSLDHNLKTLKHRWDAAITKANDRKVDRDFQEKYSYDYHAREVFFI